MARRASGAPHVLVVRTPDERLTWLQALGSRRKEDVTAGIPALFTGFLITDGYKAYQGLLPRLAGVQQCCQHVIRRCRAVTKLGPGSLQSWAADVISILREAHQAVEEARARGDTALDPEQLEKLRQRYDEAAAFGITHNRLRDWHDGNHPGYALGCWLQEYKEQVWLFTREFAVEWTSKQRRAGRQGTQTAPGRLRLLAHPAHPRPLVPHPQLPRLRQEPRPARPRRHPRRTRRKTLATATPRTGLTPDHAPPVNGHARPPDTVPQVRRDRTDRPPRRSGPPGGRSRPRAGAPPGDGSPHVELSDAPGQLRSAAEEAAQAWVDDSSLSLRYTMPWGEEYTGAALVDMYLAELAAHAWDLARATGQLDKLDPSLAWPALEGARAMIKPQYRNMVEPGAPFGAEVYPAPGADDWERLAAFMGRDPRTTLGR